ncbi:DUF4817 domain-containing protein [Trichonephila clavipes]|nr:DUF4817 domain-containing protein [Trichonephila clavipes]
MGTDHGEHCKSVVLWFAIAYSRILILRILVQENEMYTNEEYCEMVLLYGQYNRNKREAARLYAIKFPSRRHPSYCTIARAVQRLYQIRSCHRRIPFSGATPSADNH